MLMANKKFSQVFSSTNVAVFMITEEGKNSPVNQRDTNMGVINSMILLAILKIIGSSCSRKEIAMLDTSRHNWYRLYTNCALRT